MKFLWSYLKKYPGQILGALLGSGFFVAVTLGLPTLLAKIIDNAFILNDKDALYRYVAMMFVLVLAGFLGQLMSRYFVSKLGNGVTRDMRNDVYGKIQRMSHAEFRELGVASLSTRITTDAFVLLQFTVLLLGMGLTSPIMILVSVFMIARLSVNLGMIVLPIVPIIILIILVIIKITLPISEKQQATLDDINQTQRENITGLRVIRAFNREDHQEEKFNKVNDLYRSHSKKLFEILAIPQPSFMLLINIALILVIWFGAGYIGDGTLQVGNLVAMIQYVVEALFSFTLFSNIFMMYPRAQVSAERLQEVMDTPISVKNSKDPIMETDGSGRLAFKNVDFTYPDADKPVLRNINFSTKAGETIAFIGSTGSGKSTIVKLIPRFYDITHGQILLDGIDIRDLDIKVLRDKIGYTPQTANLFTGDISGNLRYGKEDANHAEMKHSTDVAQASEFINKMETGYDTHLAEGGSNLSGGQKQRLSIARSVINKHEVYIFDDTFSALDYKTDSKLRAELAKETKDATTVIVAQRISTIMNADQIIVLDHGEIAAKGTHKELLKNSELYREIAESQLTKEELENA